MILYDDFLDKLTKTKLGRGKDLIELTTYKDLTMWLFVRVRFFDFMTRVLNEGLHIRLTRRRPVWMFYKIIEPFLDLLTKTLISSVMTFYPQKDVQQSKSSLPKICFIAQDIEWKVVRNYETGKLEKSDAFFDSTIKRLGDACKFVGIYPIEVSTRNFKVFIDKLRNWYVPHKPFNVYWSLHVWRKEEEASNHFRRLWKDLAKDVSFKNLCTYNGRNLHAQIEAELEFYFCVLFPRVVKHIEVAKRMIANEKPSLLLVQNEYGEFERALVVAGKLKGIPTVAVQHGVITPKHLGYMFQKEDRTKVVLPDITCVFGQYYYDLLANESIYKPSQVVVTGQPRYDILYHAGRIYSKDRFLKEYKIDPSHRVLLWTTQCHGFSDEENIRNFRVVFETVEKIENVTLVIKQHPGEDKRYTEMIRDNLANYKIDAVVTPTSSDTYEQLHACDLLITKSSTTAMEAVALNKPVIVLNLGGEADIVDYAEQGVALGVYKEEDLNPSIEKLLKDDSELAKNRQRYIEKYLYKIDGKATERVIGLIERMIKKKETMK